MALGESRWDLGERAAALESFDRAAEAAEAADEIDVVIVTAIEVARQRNHNPFVPDPPARQRLSDLDQQLPAVDSALRAALLGRRAMLALQPPARLDEASALADAAVAMARRLDDPDALLTALCDRAFVVGSAEDMRRRKDLAEEVLELARVSGRPDRAVAGHEWRFDDCLTRGDLIAAARALDEFEALASVAPSPFWRYTSSLRRAMLLLVQGDRDGAVETIAASAQASSGLVDRFELIGFELGHPRPGDDPVRTSRPTRRRAADADGRDVRPRAVAVHAGTAGHGRSAGWRSGSGRAGGRRVGSPTPPAPSRRPTPSAPSL